MATPTEEGRLRRWRLVLGKESQTIPGRAGMDDGLAVNLDSDDAQMDKVLEALYDSHRSAGLGSSCRNDNRWLGDIRTYFPKSVIQVLQKDALLRLNLQQMLLEPEALDSVEPDDIHLVEMPSFACTPDLFPALMATAIRKGNIAAWGPPGTRSSHGEWPPISIERLVRDFVPSHEVFSLGTSENPRSGAHRADAAGADGAGELQTLQLGTAFE
jgi:hypothetical protein